MTTLVWEDAKTSKPPEDERVLLKIKHSSHPVIAYFSNHWWEVCTDNLRPAFEDYGEVGNFLQKDVIQYARLGL
jgi:hypothetical protein